MPYGGHPRRSPPSYSGFVNGDNVSSLTTRAVCVAAATSSSPVAGSPVRLLVRRGIDPNYSISYVSGSVSGSAVPLTITPRARRSRTELRDDHSGLFRLRGGDTASSLTTAPTCTTTETSSSAAGGSPYASSCGGAVDSNYTISYIGGSVVVDRAPLTITASSATVAYQGAPPPVTPTYDGFENGDTVSSLTPAASCSTPPPAPARLRTRPTRTVQRCV